MLPPSGIQRRAWMTQWRSAAVELARVRRAELDSVDLSRVASDLEDACLASARVSGPAQLSGLVEQQRLLHRGRRA